MRQSIAIVLLLSMAAWAGSATQPDQPDRPPEMVLRVYDIRDYLKGFSDYPLYPASPRANGPMTRPAPPNVFSNAGPGAAAIGAGDRMGSERDKIDSLIRLIETTAEPDVWADTGGTGSITALDGKLYVTAPADVQAVGAMLVDDVTADADRTVHITAEWLALTDADLAAMRNPAGGDGAVIRLAEPAVRKAAAMARSQLLCLDGQTVHIATGSGKGSIKLQIRPRVMPGGKQVILDVLNRIGDARPSQEFHTTARIPLGEDVVIGGITDELSGKDQPKQLYLVIRVDAAD